MDNCPEYITALLEHIEYAMELRFWNKFKKDWNDWQGYGNPFQNSGNVKGFNNGTFEVHAYDWGADNQDPEAPHQYYNFKCGDVEISWYKYLGRGMWINKPKITPAQVVKMFDKCMASLEWEWNNRLDNDPVKEA